MKRVKKFFSKLLSKKPQGHILGSVWSMYHKGEYKDAYAAFCDIMDKYPDLRNLGDVYTLWADLEFSANDDACRAIELLDVAREKGISVEGYYYAVRGDAMLRIGNCEEARQNYEQSIAIDPDVRTLTMLGQALSEMNDSNATEVWQRILEMEPSNCFAHVYVGLEAIKSGDRGKAFLMAKRAEKLDPSVDDLLEIGYLYYTLGEFNVAIKTYLEVNRLGYKDKGFLYALIAACYLSLNEAVPARKYVQWAIRCNPENYYVKDVLHEYEERFGNIEQNNKDREEK